MRLNIEFIPLWIHGKPIKTWIWHKWYQKKGSIQGKWSCGFNIFEIL